MIKKLKKKIMTAIFAALLIASSIGYIPAEARPWNFEGDTYHEGTPLEMQDIPNADSVITLSFRDTDVKQIMRMFADKAGLNIVFIGDVDGSVTMDLVDTTLGSAMSLVAETSRLTYLVDNNTLVVMSIDSARENNYAKKQ